MKVAHLSPALCSPMYYSLLDSSVHGILQARVLECLLCPVPGDFSHPGTEPRSPALQADSLPSEPPGKWQRSNWMTLETNKLWKIIKEMGKPDPHICLLRNISACVSRSNRTDMQQLTGSKFVKGIHKAILSLRQGILSLCLLLSHFSRVQLCATP